MIKKKLVYTVYPVNHLVDGDIQKEDELYILGEDDRAKATKIFRKEHYDKLEAGMFLGEGSTKCCMCEIEISRFINACNYINYIESEETVYE